jgi:MoxR-like ATPase
VIHGSNYPSVRRFSPVRSAASRENRLSRGGVRGLYEEMEKLKQGGAALKDRVVLAGRSGTGKTRLVRK